MKNASVNELVIEMLNNFRHNKIKVNKLIDKINAMIAWNNV